MAQFSGAGFPWTFDQAFEPQESWYLDGEPIPEVVTETAEPTGLSLTLRVETQTLLSRLRTLKEDEGKVDILTTDSGGFTAVDRANGENTFTLTPPTRREPLRLERAYHVERYDEELVSQDVTEWDIELDLVASQNRTDTPSINEGGGGAVFDWTFPQTFGTGVWAFETRLGTITTDRVTADLAGTGRDGVQRFELNVTLEKSQSHAFEAALNRLNATRVQQVVDATNQILDETDDGAATLTITSQDEETVTSGEYVVNEWSSERLNDAFQRVEFVVAPKA